MAARKTKKAEPVAAEPVTHAAELVLPAPRKSAVDARREQEDALGGIKNKIFGDSMRVVEDFLRARDIDPEVDQDRDPAYYRMMSELGDEEEVKKAYRLARTGWLPSAETPGFVKVAVNMATGIMKANAAEKGGSKVLNVERVVLISDSSVPKFTESEVE
jgi:hypothetical protein